MAPYDAPFDPESNIESPHLLRAMTMAFMLFLSERPHMMIEFKQDFFANFPYDDYRLTAFTDKKTGAITFMLVSDREEVH